MKSGGILVVEDEMIVAMGIKFKLEEMIIDGDLKI